MKKEFIIQSIIDKIHAQTYLEIGVQRGKNFFQIRAPFKIAVDPNFMFGYKRSLLNLIDFLKSKLFEMTSDDFFIKKAPGVLKDRKITVAFIDGLHTYEQSLADFKNCLAYSEPGAVLLFHDCNPASKEAAEYAHSPKEMQERHPGKNPEWNGDVWKSIVHLRSLHPDLEVFVLDCDYGVGVVRRKKPAETLSFTQEEIKNLSYADLEANRDKFLNLKKPEYLNEFLTTL